MKTNSIAIKNNNANENFKYVKDLIAPKENSRLERENVIYSPFLRSFQLREKLDNVLQDVAYDKLDKNAKNLILSAKTDITAMEDMLTNDWTKLIDREIEEKIKIISDVTNKFKSVQQTTQKQEERGEIEGNEGEVVKSSTKAKEASKNPFKSVFVLKDDGEGVEGVKVRVSDRTKKRLDTINEKYQRQHKEIITYSREMKNKEGVNSFDRAVADVNKMMNLIKLQNSYFNLTETLLKTNLSSFGNKASKGFFSFFC